MAGDPHVRKYRACGTGIGAVLVFTAIPMALGEVQVAYLWGGSEPVRWVLWGVPAVWSAVLLVWFVRSATFVSREHIVIRELFRTTPIPWAYIKRIEIESQFMSRGIPQFGVSESVVLYDRSGRRRPLPHFNDRDVDPALFRDEAEALLETWKRLTGRKWSTSSAATHMIVRRPTHRLADTIDRRTWIIIGSMAGVIVILLVIGSIHPYESHLVAFLASPFMMIMLPVLALLIAAAITKIRRGR